MQIATKTLAAIEEAFQKDQGAKYRGFLKELMPLAGDAYSTDEEEWRKHLGASLIGRDCSRELWYSFHWASRKRFDGRMLRLFNRGHLEEPRFVALLMMIGCKVWQLDENGKQFRVKGYKGHFAGSLDGVALGVPDVPDVPVLTEFKTHADKSFQKLITEGVLSAKWEHFIQMQIYMGANSLTHALYCAVNKNDDNIHMEIVQFDRMVYELHLKKAEEIIDARQPPKRINESPGFYKCKFCDQARVCHGFIEPVRHCRTCYWSYAGEKGEWFCRYKYGDGFYGNDVSLSFEEQKAGCQAYEPNK